MTMTVERPAALQATAEEPAEQERLRVWRWTRDDYHRAGDLGLFGDLRVELLDGEILVMASQKTPHFTSLRFTEITMNALFGADYEVRAQGPIVLSDDSEPEPDVVVVPGRARDYADHHPTPAEIRLLVEVSDATLATDRGSKRTAYAREGISEYWIINLVHRQLEAYRDPVTRPEGAFYRTTRILLPGESLAPLFASEPVIAVADLFPPTDVGVEEPSLG